MNRRKFIKQVAYGAGVTAAGSLVPLNFTKRNPTAKWNNLYYLPTMISGRPHFKEGLVHFVRRTAELTKGSVRFNFKALPTEHGLRQPFAVRLSSPVLFKSPYSQISGEAGLLGSLSLGLSAHDKTNWLQSEEGNALWRELYGREEMVPLLFGIAGHSQSCAIRPDGDKNGRRLVTRDVSTAVCKVMNWNADQLSAQDMIDQFKATNARHSDSLATARWLKSGIAELDGVKLQRAYWLSPVVIDLQFFKGSWDAYSSKEQESMQIAAREASHLVTAREAALAAHIEKKVNELGLWLNSADGAEMALGHERLITQLAESSDWASRAIESLKQAKIFGDNRMA